MTPVFRPAHYSRFIIEPVTFIAANGLNFNVGNVIKYVCRAPFKGGVEDMEKAKRFIDMEVETWKRTQRIAAGSDPAFTWKDIL